MMSDALALTRLLQLASPTLPVGAYAYSQGLEWAAASGAVRDEASAQRWIGDALEFSIAGFEAPLLLRMMRAWSVRDVRVVAELNDWFLASRETSELHAETLQMGYSLARLLQEFDDLPTDLRQAIGALSDPTFPAAWACAATGWQIDPASALHAYLWSWLENQVMAAIKIVPLGQSAGQRILARLGAQLPALVEQALVRSDDELSNFVPGLAIASSRHETQYSRLFRS